MFAYIDMLGIKKILEDLGNLMAASDELFESIQNQTILKQHKTNAKNIARTMVWQIFGLQWHVAYQKACTLVGIFNIGNKLFTQIQILTKYTPKTYPKPWFWLYFRFWIGSND